MTTKTISGAGLTVDDFLNSGWEAVVSGANEPSCIAYVVAFGRQQHAVDAAVDGKQTQLFLLLQAVTVMRLKRGDLDGLDCVEPFEPTLALDGDALAFLSAILPHVTDSELKARIADVLWVYARNQEAARAAVPAYLTAAEPFETSGVANEATARITRAFDIAAALGDADLVSLVAAHTEGLFLAGDPDAQSPPFHGPAMLMRILAHQQDVDAPRYAVAAVEIAETAEAAGDWRRGREYWVEASVWHERAGDGVAEYRAKLRVAETFLKEARATLAAPVPTALPTRIVATHLLERALVTVRALRSHHAADAVRLDALEPELLDLLAGQCVPTASEATVAIPQPLEITANFDGMVALVSGKGVCDTLLSLALAPAVPSKSGVRALAESECNLDPLARALAAGRASSTGTSADTGVIDADEDLLNRMYSVGQRMHAAHAHQYVEPIRNRILLEHRVTTDDLLAVVMHSPFVPNGREMLFARGLLAGLRGDFAVSLHLLIPQIENSVRHILDQKGVLTSGLDARGIQDDLDLNRTLREEPFATPLTEILGADTVFSLRGLLIEQYGGNYRNRLAHGLLDDAAFFSPLCSYLWWVALRLCCVPLFDSVLGSPGGSQHVQAEAVTEGLDG